MVVRDKRRDDQRSLRDRCIGMVRRAFLFRVAAGLVSLLLICSGSAAVAQGSARTVSWPHPRRPDIRIGYWEDESKAPVEALLYRPAAVAISAAGDFYVYDTGNHRIVVFGKDGGYLREFGRFGMGPGELLGDAMHAENDLALAEAHVVVLQMPMRRITVFNLDGSHHSTFSLTTSVHSIAADGNAIYVANSPTNAAAASILVYSLEGDLLAELGRPPYPPSGPRDRSRRLNRAWIAKCSDADPVLAYAIWPMVTIQGESGADTKWFDFAWYGAGFLSEGRGRPWAFLNRKEHFGKPAEELPAEIPNRRVHMDIACLGDTQRYAVSLSDGFVQAYSPDWKPLFAFEVAPPETSDSLELDTPWLLDGLAATSDMVCGIPLTVSEVWCFRVSSGTKPPSRRGGEPE